MAEVASADAISVLLLSDIFKIKRAVFTYNPFYLILFMRSNNDVITKIQLV